MGRESAIRKTAAFKWAVLLAALLVVLGPAAAWLSGRTGGAQAGEPTSGGSAGRQASSLPSSSNSTSEKDMDAAFLLKLEADLVRKQAARSREALRAHGYAQEVARPESSSTYLTSGGRKFGVIRTRLAADGASVYTLLVVGLAGNQLRRVVCISRRAEVDFETGPCADRIFDTFGQTL